MGVALIRTALRRSLAQIQHVSPVPPRQATNLVAAVYRQVERDFGMLAPPVALHSPAPEPLAACWLMLRESLVAAGRADRATKEVVAAAVSAGNTCPYCVDVHDATLRGLIREPETDERLRGIEAWARASGRAAAAARQEIPFPAEQAAELVGVVVTFHYLNRMVNVFLGDSPLPPTVPDSARDTARRVLGRFMGRSARKARPAGAALDLLPAAPAAGDLGWAAGNPTVADAFTRAYAAIDGAACASVPERVRELVAARVAAWDGRPAGPSRAWVAEAVAGLPAAERPAGRLALLVALASYQVDAAAVEDVRHAGVTDRGLIELTSWASLTAARRVGSWLPAGQHASGR